MTNPNFGVSVTTDTLTGEVLAVYFQIRRGRVHVTREYAEGAAVADYNKSGELMGIELLEPCKVQIVDQLAEAEPVGMRRDVKRFMRKSGPPALVSAR